MRSLLLPLPSERHREGSLREACGRKFALICRRSSWKFDLRLRPGTRAAKFYGSCWDAGGPRRARCLDGCSAALAGVWGGFREGRSNMLSPTARRPNTCSASRQPCRMTSATLVTLSSSSGLRECQRAAVAIFEMPKRYNFHSLFWGSGRAVN